MIWYNKRTIFGNTHCLRKLDNFRSDLITYFNNIKQGFGSDYSENEVAAQARGRINRSLNEVHRIVLGAAVSPVLTYTPPPMIGGYRQNIDLIANIFNLSGFRVEPNSIVDIVDRAIGQYESDRTNSIVRTFNPFFWFGRFLDLLVSLPFRILSKLGLNSKKIEESVMGKIAKVILYIISFLASLLTILQILGYSDIFKNFIINFFNI